MTFSPILIVHICAGIIAVFAGSAALVVRKGSTPHRRTGDVFVISMLFMAASGASMALVKSQRMNVLAGVFTFCLVATAALTVMRREKLTSRHLPEIPVLIVVVIKIFWLCRLLFTKVYRQPAGRSLQNREAATERQVHSIAA